MNPKTLKLPSNFSFGLFWFFILLTLSLYFIHIKFLFLGYMFLTIDILLLLITLIKPRLLHPLNSLWMRFGIMLSFIFSPLIMALIFFGIFTPISIFFRLIKRDELMLKISSKEPSWKNRDINQPVTNFKNQY